MKTRITYFLIFGLFAAASLTEAQSSYQIQIQAGFNLIANQLDHGSNALNEIMPNVPDGCVLVKCHYTGGPIVADVFLNTLGGWARAPGRALTLNPGEGAFLFSPSNFTLTFTGTPHVPVLPVTIPAGACYLLSRQTNDLATPEDIVGTILPNGSRAYKWNGSGYQIFSKIFGLWQPAVPTNAVGESMWISISGSPWPASLFFKDDNATPLNQVGSWYVFGGSSVPPGPYDIPMWNGWVTAPNCTNDLGGDMTWGGIEILNPAAAITITGTSTLTLDGLSGTGIDMNGASQNLTIECPLTILPQAWEVASGRTLTVDGVISGNGILFISGGGLVMLNGLNTYAGLTRVSSGTLLINGQVVDDTEAIETGTIGGQGVVGGSLTIPAGATLAPGASGIGTLTVSNQVTLAGTTVMELDRTSTPNSDRVVAMTTVTYGGTLTVTNLGPALQAGDTFTLFSASSFFDIFTEVALPPLGSDLVWDTSQLPTNGTISVMTMVGDKWKADNTIPLNQAASWTDNALPGTGDFAVWSSIVTAPNTTNQLGGEMTWGGIEILDPGAPVDLTGSNTLSLAGVGTLGIHMSGASQDLTIECPLMVLSDQLWTVRLGYKLNVKAVTLSAPLHVIGAGDTRIDEMHGTGVYPAEYDGSSYSELGLVDGPLSLLQKGGGTLALTGLGSYTGTTTVSNGTLQLVATASNTVTGVCSALGTNTLTVAYPATVQLLADSDTTFTGGAQPDLNGNVTISVGPVTPGTSNVTVTLDAAALKCSWASNVVNLVGQTNGFKLNMGVFKTSGGLTRVATAGMDVYVAGISSNGVYPAEFDGSSYGSPAEIEWDFGDGADACGSIVGVSSFTKRGDKPLILNGTNNYSGPTIIRDGSALLSGQLVGGSSVTVQDNGRLIVGNLGSSGQDGVVNGPVTVETGGTLGGNGLINGPVRVEAGGTCAVDSFFDVFIEISTDGSRSLTISNTLSLAGTTWLAVNRTNTPNSERIVGMSAVTYGGTLVVTNRGPALQAGDTFTLFSASSFFDVFTELDLPLLEANLMWDTSQLAINGTISVTVMVGHKWKADNSISLNQATSWTNNAVPGVRDFAVWSSIVTVPNTINELGGDMTWGGIEILDPEAAVDLTGSNTLTLAGIDGVGINLSNAAQNLTVDCPLTANSNQSWVIGAGRQLNVDQVEVHQGIRVDNAGLTRINQMHTLGVYPSEFEGASLIEVGPIDGVGSIVQNGPGTLALFGANSYSGTTTVSNGTLQLQANPSNTVAGVYSALGTNTLTLEDGATLQLQSDGDTAFAGGASPVMFGNVMLRAGPATPGASNVTVTLNAAALICSGLSNVVSFRGETNGFAVIAPVVKTHGGPVRVETAGLALRLSGISSNGVYPAEFSGSSYGSPSEVEWDFGDGNTDTCGPIMGVDSFIKSGDKMLGLTGNNVYNGDTFVNDGPMVLAGNNTGVTGTTHVNNGATLGLLSTSNNTTAGVCAAAPAGPIQLGDGATLELRGDSDVTFATAAQADVEGNVTIHVEPLTAGVSNQMVTLGAPTLLCSGTSNVVMFRGQTNGFKVAVGQFRTHAGPLLVKSEGMDVYVSGISSNGVYPAEFEGGSYGSPSEVEWDFGDGADACGPIVGVASFDKRGNKPLRLEATNDLSGPTTVHDGPMVVTGQMLGGGSITVTDGGTLAGKGVISGPVTVQPGASMRPGTDVEEIINARTSTLTINNMVSLAGTVRMLLNRTNTPNCDRVIGITTLTSGGTLTVTNRGPALQAGDTFTLFSASSYTGSFATVNLPPLDAGLLWDTSLLGVNGSISVALSSPGSISFQMTNGTLNLNWPANQGWMLQQTTNLIGPWTDVMTTTNSFQTVPAWPEQFFRLRTSP